MRLLLSLIIVVTTAPAWAASSFVQAKGGLAFTANIVTANLDASTTTGNVLACAVHWRDNTSTIDTVIESNGNTLVDSGLGVQRLNSAHSMQMFYKENITGGATPIVTATFAAAATPSQSSITCHEITSRLVSGALDQKQWNTQNFAGTGTDFITSGTVTTTTNGQYLFCATQAEFESAVTAGTGFTADTASTAYVLTEHLTDDQAAAGSTACTFTPGDNDGYITGIMTFKSESGGGGGPSSVNYYFRRAQ